MVTDQFVFTEIVPSLDPYSLRRSICDAFSGSHGVDDFRVEYLLSELLSKYSDGSTRRDSLVAAALERLELSEQMCGAANDLGFTPYEVDEIRFRNIRRRVHKQSYLSRYMEQVLFYARRRCAEVLGTEMYAWVKDARLTNGASLAHKRKDAYPYAKLAGDFTVTPAAEPYLRAFVSLLNPKIFSRAKIKLSAWNRVETVPKNDKTDRVICIEPEGNILLQKGVGTWLKRRLKKFGVDLYDQSRNRRMARESRLATVDLSMASDTLSIRIVHEVLPPAWFKLLDDLRSHYGLMPDGSVRRWKKFPSMGNGFTFELESLVFHSLLYGVSMAELGNYVAEDFAVFGDDLICPCSIYDSLSAVLSGCGFKVNLEKTFSTGPFRESCGAHYYEGVLVTPFYVRKPIDSVARYIWLSNALRKWCAGELDIADPRGFAIWKDVSSQVPHILHDRLSDVDDGTCVANPAGESTLRWAPTAGRPWTVSSMSAVAAMLLQAPCSGREPDLRVKYLPGGAEESALDEIISNLQWVYSGLDKYKLRQLLSSQTSVGPGVISSVYAARRFDGRSAGRVPEFPQELEAA